MEAIVRKYLTEDEYLALEEESDEKHEFVNGEMIAMSGGTHTHNTISANVIGELRSLLKRRPCIVMSNDQRVNIDPTGMYAYPDVTIVCGQPRSTPKSRTTVTNPTVLIEVLSKDTEAYDRGAKFAHFRHLESLQAYILVSQKPRRIEHFQRMPSGQWLLTVAEEGEVEIPSLGVSLSLDEVYAKVDLLEGADEPG
jgi:Uma2 family endonuclease